MKKMLVLLMVAIMLAVGINAAFEKVNTYSNNFADVAATSWYAENVKTAYELGFMNGKSEGKFDPNGNVTVAEGITMASRLNAIYNGTEITGANGEVPEYRIDFDDPSILVDLSERNSRNNSGINFSNATGEIKDGMIILQPDALQKNGTYDPGIMIEGLDLNTKNYNKLTFRMKRDKLDNPDPEAKRNEWIEIFYKTSVSPSISNTKCAYVSLSNIENLSDWFEIEVELSQYISYTDYLTGLRFDTTNNNGIYYIDYIVLSKSEKYDKSKWYDVYVDYAIKNGIIDKGEFSVEDFARNITRRELCNLFAAALPEEYYTPINSIKGIPDIAFDDVDADVLLMLYNAGVLLGSDSEGTFNADSDIKRSEVAAIINRSALPENRVKGSISTDWLAGRNDYRVEFDDKALLDKVAYEAETIDIVDGKLVLTPRLRDNGTYDPKIVFKNISLDSQDYTKFRVRMKPEFADEGIDSDSVEIFFMCEGDADFSQPKRATFDYVKNSYRDAAGWYIIEMDLRLNQRWQGKITGLRLDPTGKKGTYKIDYVRLINDKQFQMTSHEDLLNAGYTATRLMQDEGFERGFYVAKWDQSVNALKHGMFTDYCETDEKPLWYIAPWWSQYDLYENRDTTTDKYTLRDDKGVNTIIYNPEEKSLSMRLDATKVYNGEPYFYENKNWWAHLLLDQTSGLAPVDKQRNTAGADRLFVELDVRLTDFKDTINPEGENTCAFMTYFYLFTDKAPGQRIWFGLDIMNGTNANAKTSTGWSPDTASHQYMYKLPQALVFDGVENSFNPEPGVVVVSDEWKHIRVDVTPHIDRVVELANNEKSFGVSITKDDLYFSGVNIGYEIWGNYDCTFEIKNFNMVSYNKAD